MAQREDPASVFAAHKSEASSDPEAKFDADATLDSAANPSPYADLGSIGRYRLLRKIGEGGMGQVWLAEQASPVKRQVALKLIKGSYDSGALQRFDIERQSLAIMDHPAIAKVFDADSTSQGQPYFVMEYVPGLPITTYCDQKRLTIRQRLELFVKVCEGVQHAHQKAIIHRDLKPSNVLVIEVDGQPQPRIIDFGIAKAISQQSADETHLTRVGGMVGTPGYISPEQADPGIVDVDTRTDVYSLGVILYELLTGSQPFDRKQWTTKPLDEILRQMREDDPPSPSTKLNVNPKSSTEAAEKRRIDPKQLVSLLRGDLDCIALKAMEKDRSRRYGAPSELAADILRSLHNEPVSARPASAAYRLRKYVRRHRIVVAMASALVLLLLGFGVTEFLQLRRVTRERDRASRISDFMVNMFKVADPNEARGNTVTAREILDKGSNDIKTGLAQDPEVQSDLIYTMANTYVNLGLFARAHELSNSALEIRRRLLGPKNVKTLQSMAQLGWILDREGNDTEAEKITRQAIDEDRSVLGSEDLGTVDAMSNLAVILENQGRYAEAEKLHHTLVEIQTRRLGPDNVRTIRAMSNLASTIGTQGRYKEAEALYQEDLARAQRTLGPNHPQTIVLMHNLANMLQEQGHYAEAEDLYRQTMAISQRVFGPDHPNTADTAVTLANALQYGEGRTAEAEALYRKSLETEERVIGPDHPMTVRAREGLANLLSSEGHYAEAEKMLRQVFATRLRTLPPEHTDVLLAKYNIASVTFNEKRFAEAEKLFREVLEAQTRVLGPENPDTLATQASLSRVLASEGHPQESETMARKTFDTQLRVLGPHHADTLATLQDLGIAMAANHHYPEAKKLFANVIEQASQTDDSSLSVAWYDFADVAAAAGDRDQALHHLREAINHGYKDLDLMRNDEHLKSLQRDPRFEALIKGGKSLP